MMTDEEFEYLDLLDTYESNIFNYVIEQNDHKLLEFLKKENKNMFVHIKCHYDTIELIKNNISLNCENLEQKKIIDNIKEYREELIEKIKYNNLFSMDKNNIKINI